MISKSKIEGTLKKLERKYQAALLLVDPEDSVLYSKLALMEYCGWIEESMDCIAERSIKGKIKTTVFKDILSSSMANNYGFKYKDHFRSMMVKILGLEDAERLQVFLDKKAYLATLESELDSLWKLRCDAAHRSVHSATMKYDSPSVVLGRMGLVAPILKDMYSYASKI